jgi:hypothetical protein
MRFLTTMVGVFVLAWCIVPQSMGRKAVFISYSELLDMSDLVVIARPITRTGDTKEQAFLPNIQNGDGTKVKVIGVETSFEVEVVLKGTRTVQEFVLHHYREPSPGSAFNGPELVFFDRSSTVQESVLHNYREPSPRAEFNGPQAVATSASTWLLFLVREKDGRYAPAGGQTDPGGMAIRRLR